MAASIMMKNLVLVSMLLVAVSCVDADDADPPPSSSADPLPQFPPPMPCMDQCALSCSGKKGFRRMWCMGKCLVICRIASPDHAGYHCTHHCVFNNLRQHHQPDIKSIAGLVNTCYHNCSKHV